MPRLVTIISWLLLANAPRVISAQSANSSIEASLSRVDSLGLSSAESAELKRAVQEKDYVSAEKLLLAELQKDSRSPRAAQLLNFAGAIYFLAHDYLNAAVAWKKSESIAPLENSVQFSLAMAYVKLHHADWAIAVLQSLAANNPREAIYPYWLGRLQYDGHLYDQAIAAYKRALALSPSMARAYDGLGLCYFYENQNDLAVRNYETAISLDQRSGKPSAWPYFDLALTLEFLHRTREAEDDLAKAIQIEPGLAQAHFHLGNLLRNDNRIDDAICEFKTAAQLDPHYAEPHFALARLYNGLGQKAAAENEVNLYHRIHDHPELETGPQPTREE